MANNGHFYISDWKLNVLFEVERYLLEDVLRVLTTKYDEFPVIKRHKWKPTEPGSIQSYSFEEYLSK